MARWRTMGFYATRAVQTAPSAALQTRGGRPTPAANLLEPTLPCSIVASKTDIVTLPGEGKTLSMGGLGVIYKIHPDDTDGAISIVEHPIEPGRLVRPHTHVNEDEISYVVHGDVGMKVGDKEFLAGPGTWVFKPRGTPHTFWNAGTTTARIIEIIVPGAFGCYFEELAATLSAPGPPNQARLAEVARKWGLTYQMDWVPPLKARYNLKLLGEK